MFDPIQKSILIGYFTNRGAFLGRLIPLLSVFMDQSKTCVTLLAQL